MSSLRNRSSDFAASSMNFKAINQIVFQPNRRLHVQNTCLRMIAKDGNTVCTEQSACLCDNIVKNGVKRAIGINDVENIAQSFGHAILCLFFFEQTVGKDTIRRIHDHNQKLM